MNCKALSTDREKGKGKNKKKMRKNHLNIHHIRADIVVFTTKRQL